MPSFDITSEVDHQEIRNAVDQATREVTNRFDFKNTDPSIELDDTSITLRCSSTDRLNALRQVVEEKLVKRQVSMKAVSWGNVEDAAGGDEDAGAPTPGAAREGGVPPSPAEHDGAAQRSAETAASHAAVSQTAASETAASETERPASDEGGHDSEETSE